MQKRSAPAIEFQRILDICTHYVYIFV